MERICATNYPTVTGKYRPEQIAHMSTWEGIPDSLRSIAAVNRIRVLPKNGSTETLVNPLDTGDPETSMVYDHNDGFDTLFPAGMQR